MWVTMHKSSLTITFRYFGFNIFYFSGQNRTSNVLLAYCIFILKFIVESPKRPVLHSIRNSKIFHSTFHNVYILTL